MAVGGILSSCGGVSPKDIHPSFLDVPKGYSRIYQAVKVSHPACGEPEYKYVYSGKTKPIDQMNGEICLSAKEAQKLITAYNENYRREADCDRRHE